MNRLIVAGAVSYAGLGVIGLVAPDRIPRTFGGTAETPDARTEVRAVYGGLPLAMAGSLLVMPSSVAPIAVLTAGFAIGRVASMAIEDDPVSAVNKGLAAIEGGLAVALFVGALTGRGQRRSPQRLAPPTGEFSR